MAVIPLPVVDQTHAVDALDADAASRARARALLARVTVSEYRSAQQAVVLGSLADLLGERDLQRALDAFSASLQNRFGADRVAIALWEDDETLSIGALSGQALVDVASAEVQLLLDALSETLALERTVSYPDRETRPGALAAHRALAGRRAGPVLVSLPLYHDAAPVGAMLIERSNGEPFAKPTLELIEHVALAVGPLIAVRREAQLSAWQKAKRTGGEKLSTLISVDRPGRALVLSLAGATLLLVGVFPIDRHVVAEAELVPLERRLIMAPIDGFVDEVAITAGDVVSAGQVLARFDRRELDLELARRNSEIDGAQSELRSAMASHDRKATSVARARLRRGQAQRALVEQRISRSELRAPIDGVVISGEPSDISGVPVARGDTLFEIAPAEGFEVHLLVSEDDLARVVEGQKGALALRTAPDEELAISVQAIHPAGESGNGETRFRVRAELDREPGLALRPGQSGIGRLAAGRETWATRVLRPLGRRLQALRWKFLG